MTIFHNVKSGSNYLNVNGRWNLKIILIQVLTPILATDEALISSRVERIRAAGESSILLAQLLALFLFHHIWQRKVHVARIHVLHRLEDIAVVTSSCQVKNAAR